MKRRLLSRRVRGLVARVRHLLCEGRALHERLELLEDSLEARAALEAHRRSGEAAIPWEELRAELGL